MKTKHKRKKYCYYYGVYGVRFISHGNWNDAELQYRGYVFNEPSIAGALWDDFCDLYRDDNAILENEDAWLKYVKTNVKEMLLDCIASDCYEYRVA